MVASLDCVLFAVDRHFLLQTTRVATLSAELLQISSENPDPAAIRYAADFIRRGELVAIPTDTFYGIAADPFNLAAVDQIYRVKGRPERVHAVAGELVGWYIGADISVRSTLRNQLGQQLHERVAAVLDRHESSLPFGFHKSHE